MIFQSRFLLYENFQITRPRCGRWTVETELSEEELKQLCEDCWSKNRHDGLESCAECVDGSEWSPVIHPSI